MRYQSTMPMLSKHSNIWQLPDSPGTVPPSRPGQPDEGPEVPNPDPGVPVPEEPDDTPSPGMG